METLKTPAEPLISPNFPMNAASANLRTRLRFFSYTKARALFTSSVYLPITHQLIHGRSRSKRGLDNGVRVSVKLSNAEMKENWLGSLCCPLPHKSEDSREEPSSNGVGLGWIIGIDPDLSGALALLKPEESGFSAQVFDNPYVQVLVGKTVRKRLDAKSIVQMLRNFGAPHGTTAYIEQSIPFPQDGKQGWWSGGFGYGMWIGVLVASGFSVVPVPSSLWKNHFELSGSLFSKDDSRKAACTLFPSLSSLLKRKKDHGRAEALLIAAYGKGLKIKSDSVVDTKPDLCATSDLVIDIKPDLHTKSDPAVEIKPDLCTVST